MIVPHFKDPLGMGVLAHWPWFWPPWKRQWGFSNVLQFWGTWISRFWSKSIGSSTLMRSLSAGILLTCVPWSCCCCWGVGNGRVGKLPPFTEPQGSSQSPARPCALQVWLMLLILVFQRTVAPWLLLLFKFSIYPASNFILIVLESYLFFQIFIFFFFFF